VLRERVTVYCESRRKCVLCGAKCCFSLLKEPVHIPTTLLYSIKQGLANSVEQSHSWAADRSSTSQEIPSILWNSKVHYRIHRHLSLSWARSIQSMLPHSSLLKIHFHIVLLSTLRSSKLSVSLRSPHQKPVRTSPVSIHATCPADLIPLGLITRIIFDKVYRAQSCPICSLLHSLNKCYRSETRCVLIRTCPAISVGFGSFEDGKTVQRCTS